jgi:hypothetical protein
MIRILCILSVLSVALAEEKPVKPGDRIASMTWLAGKWTGKIWGGDWVCRYTAPEGGMILSTSKLLHGGKASYFEFERFDVQGDAVMMSPYPKGKLAAVFKLTELEGKRATFENPKNDYPSRIVYERVAADKLVITLSGKEKKDVFDLTRVE